MNIKSAFGNRIRDLRQKIGKTQAQFAHDVEISVDALSMIERGENWPHYETVEKLARAFNMPASDLFDNLDPSSLPARHPNHLARARATLARLPADQVTLAAELLETMERHLQKY